MDFVGFPKLLSQNDMKFAPKRYFDIQSLFYDFAKYAS